MITLLIYNEFSFIPFAEANKVHIMKFLKGVWDRHCCQSLYSLNCLCYEPFVYKVSFDYYKLLIRYSRFHNLLINMQTCLRHKFRRFRQCFDNRPYFGQPVLVPFYTFLNAVISGTRKDIKKGQRFSFQFFLYFHIKK